MVVPTKAKLRITPKFLKKFPWNVDSGRGRRSGGQWPQCRSSKRSRRYPAQVVARVEDDGREQEEEEELRVELRERLELEASRQANDAANERACSRNTRPGWSARLGRAVHAKLANEAAPIMTATKVSWANLKCVRWKM